MTSRLRLAFYAPGSSVHTRRWVESLADRGHEVLLVSQGPPGPTRVRQFDPYAGMGPLGRLPKVRALVAERRILRRLAEWGPDIVHLHWLNPTLGTLRLVRRFKRPIISVWGRDVVWDGEGKEPLLRRYFKEGILACGEVITATSKFLAERTEAFLRLRRPIRVVPFGVDCERFRPVSGERERDVPVIGYLKHYTAKYGPDVLLRACAILASRGVRFRLELHGTEDPEPYRALARELHLQERARISGAVDHDRVPETMRGFDIYVMPSVFDSETFGVSALEAAACGVPVIASRVGGVPETVLDGETGVLVPPAQSQALAYALEGLLEDPARRRRMGDRGRAFVLRSFLWEDCVRRMEEVYLEVLEESRPAGRPSSVAARS